MTERDARLQPDWTPARLNLNAIADAANTVAAELADGNPAASATFAPGDATEYGVIVIDQSHPRMARMMPGCRYMLAEIVHGNFIPVPDNFSEMGPYDVARPGSADRWNGHTAKVVALFMRHLWEVMGAIEERRN